MSKNIEIDNAIKDVLSLAIKNGYTYQDVVDLYSEVFFGKDILIDGSHGTCKWSIDRAGTLTIEPKNGIKGTLRGQSAIDYESPWESCSKDIKKVVVKEGVSLNKDASFLFSELHNCVEMDLSGLDTSKTEDMESLLSNCFSLEKLNLGNWNVSNVKNMSHMFSGCQALKTLDINSFDTKSVENASRMFKGCKALEKLNVSEKGFNLDNAFKPFMFEDCLNLKIDNCTLERLLFKPEKPVKPWTPPVTKEREQKKERTEPNR